MRIKPLSGPTWVYRISCSHERLLYVGVAYDLDRRLEQHRATKEWWSEATFIDAERYPTRLHAFKVEAHAIVYERPAYNIRGLPELPGRYDEIIGRRHYIVPDRQIVFQGGQGEWR